MQSRAQSFNDVPELYDRLRPGYPDVIFEQLKTHAHLSSQSHILEVGCGTGQATRSLKQISNHITCVEPGAALLAVAKRSFTDLEFINRKFEEFRSHEQYDLILAATAWHWVDPQRGYQNLKAHLKPGGHFAHLRNYHIEPSPQAFLNRAEPIFRPFSRSKAPIDLKSRHQIDEAKTSLETHGFRLIYSFELPWQETYTTDDYISLRHTYSPHRALPPPERESLERQLRTLANDEFGGYVTQSYTAVLLLAQPV